MKEISEKMPETKSHFPKIKAKVILCRCIEKDGFENLFGMRIEERNKIWYRTWAFKIGEEKAKHEGWDTERFTSSLNVIPEYNGCPYCDGISLAQCSCGKLFCLGRKNYSNMKQVEIKCPWCGKTSVYQTAEAFDVQGGGM